jgi:hypothetical protein
MGIAPRRVLGWVFMVDRPHVVVVASGCLVTVVMPRSHAKTCGHRSEALQRHGKRDGNEEQDAEQLQRHCLRFYKSPFDLHVAPRFRHTAHFCGHFSSFGEIVQDRALRPVVAMAMLRQMLERVRHRFKFRDFVS